MEEEDEDSPAADCQLTDMERPYLPSTLFEVYPVKPKIIISFKLIVCLSFFISSIHKMQFLVFQ